MSKIILENMKFHAYHGCLEVEKEQGNTFLVTITMEIDTSLAEITDQLNDTLNYQEVYDVVRREMKTPSNLIEHVARRIHTTIKEVFPQINSLQIELSKMNPPLGGDVEKVKIYL